MNAEPEEGIGTLETKLGSPKGSKLLRQFLQSLH